MFTEFLHDTFGIHSWEEYIMPDWLMYEQACKYPRQLRTCRFCGRTQHEIFVPAAIGAFFAWVDDDEWMIDCTS